MITANTRMKDMVRASRDDPERTAIMLSCLIKALETKHTHAALHSTMYAMDVPEPWKTGFYSYWMADHADELTPEQVLIVIKYVDHLEGGRRAAGS